jgi:hypothetical protein
VQLFKALGGGWDDALGSEQVIDVIDETGHAPAVVTTPTPS